MRSSMMTLLLAAVCLFVGVARAETVHPLTREDVDAWLDGLMPRSLQAGDIAGGVVVIVKDGEILTERGFGYSDVAAKVPVDPRTTVFRPGSISKTFTWTAVMQLVEQGKLDLDADINRYLDFVIPAYEGKPMTMRNVMTHTTGFEEKIKDIVSSTAAPSLESYVKDWIPRRIFPPGVVPAYSNYASTLAGYVVQRVSGEPYDDYMDSHVLGPLGMTQSTFRQPVPEQLQPLLSKGYLRASEPARYFEFMAPAPAGSLSATGRDMAKFMIAQLQDGTYGDARILSPQTAIQLHSIQPKVYPALHGMALGFYEHSRNGHRVIAHNGGTQFFHSDMHLFLDDGVGVFISLNSPGIDGAASGLHEALFHGFADRYFPASTGPNVAGVQQTAAVEQPTSGIQQTTALEHARLVAGTWEDSRRADSSILRVLGLLGPLTISANDDGSISFPVPRLGEQRWREVEPFVWRNVNGPDRIQVLLKDGQPSMLGLDMAPPVAFQPTPAWRSPAWVTPVLLIAIVSLLIGGISWPISAIVRRRFNVASPDSRDASRAGHADHVSHISHVGDAGHGGNISHVGDAGRAGNVGHVGDAGYVGNAGNDQRSAGRSWSTRSHIYHTARALSFAAGVLMAAVLGTLIVMASSYDLLSSDMDGWLLALKIAAMVVFVAAVPATVRDLIVGWPLRQGWFSRLWSINVAFSCIVLLAVAIVFNFANLSSNY